MDLDETRIQEIVARVLERLGDDVPSTPMEAVRRPPPGYDRPPPVARAGHAAAAAAAPTTSAARKPEARIPVGRKGVFPDVDSAVRAARRAWEQNESSSLT